MDNSINFKIKYDNDLVELAGYHAYMTYSKDTRIFVNGIPYIVVNTEYNHPSGLDVNS